MAVHEWADSVMHGVSDHVRIAELCTLHMLIIYTLLALIGLFVLAFILYFLFAPRIGSDPTGDRLARIQRSAAYSDGRFQNVVETNMDMPFRVLLKVLGEQIKGGEGRKPKDVLPTVPFDKEEWAAVPATSFAVAWFGHSSLLIKMGGTTFLVDPVFGERASTFSFAGPTRFAYDRHMTVEQLPPVDMVLLSHDHYDHLDHTTIAQLKDKRFLAPLGVGAHLEHWGVPANAITELDRWESIAIGGTRLTLTPTRHFSGRGLRNRFSTLWGAWVMETGQQRIFFGADSGYSPTFKEIGERFGVFDLALLECGAYNENWASIHMMPEETAQAAVDLGARVLMPIHWAKFSLAMHPWKEPVERLMKRADDLELPLLTPRIGAVVVDADRGASRTWWRSLR